MAQTSVTEEIDRPAAEVWAVLRDFGNVPWMPGGDQATVEGSGVGMVRVLVGGAVRERLERVDEAAMELSYTIPLGMPVPVDDYYATVRVRALGDSSCAVDWGCRFSPRDGSAEEMAAQIDQLYGMLIGWVRDHVRAG
jgi:hypothetical protein